MTTPQQREAEAVRVAEAEGYPIAHHDIDWMTFDLDDEAAVESGPFAGRPLHTFFSWNGWRYEGACTLYPLARLED